MTTPVASTIAAKNTPLTVEQQKLVEDNIKLAYSVARRLAVTIEESEEFPQQAVVIMCRAAQTYDPTKGAKFGTYASNAIRFGLMRSRKKARAATHESLDAEFEADEESSLHDVLPCQATDVVRDVAVTDSHAVLRSLIDTLPPREKMAVMEFWQGKSSRDVGDILGVSHTYAVIIHTSAVARLRRLLVERGIRRDSI